MVLVAPEELVRWPRLRTMSTVQSQVSEILRAGSNLLEADPVLGHERNPKYVLNARLQHFYASLSRERPPQVWNTVEDLHLETAQCALDVVGQVHCLLDTDMHVDGLLGDRKIQDGAPDNAPPIIGSRDLTQLRTLLTMVFRWGVDLLLTRISAQWPGKAPTRVETGIVELPEAPEDYQSLSTLLRRLAAILLPHGTHGRLSQTPISTSILDQHMVDFFRASIALGWLPKSLSSSTVRPVDDLRPVVLRLLELIPLSQVIADLGAILSGVSPPAHVRRLCSSFLSKSLLRERGINALLAVVFGEEDGSEEPPLEKYEHVGQILRTIPAGMKPEVYFTSIVPRILRILTEDVPASHRRVASFSFTRMLDPEFPHQELVSAIELPIIYGPLIPATIPYPKTPTEATWEKMRSTGTLSKHLRPSQALSIISTLLLNSDPSPVLITLILSPILPSLYALVYHLDRTKTTDPVLRDSVKAMMKTWGRVVECREGVERLWSILNGQRITWKNDDAGEFVCMVAEARDERFSLLTPEDLQKQEGYGEYEDALDLYPNAAHLVQYIKSLDRPDMSSEFFVRLLEAYHSSKYDSDSDPTRVLLYLQTTMQMRAQLSGDSSPQSILSKPEHILQFIKHALEPPIKQAPSTEPNVGSHHGLGLADLRIVPPDENEFQDTDSDDEEPSGQNGNGDDEMTETAITLLLATLEANQDLSARNAPILNDIFLLLDPHASSASSSIRNAAREAKMVMTARLASTSTVWSSPQAKGESTQETYQKALKLLQDPILPVRAHGLLLLRQLVSRQSAAPPSVTSTEAALIPSILSIFMQAVQEDDSYIFLSAIQGLSAMVDAFGKEVLNSLLDTYTQGLTSIHGGYLTKQEVAVRVRVGEALGQVIRRCGDALGKYAEVVVPRLIAVFRASQAPTVLRASAVSLLTECIKTSFVALTWYTNELSAAMIDLLQVEMVSVPKIPLIHDSKLEERKDVDKKPTLDAEIDSNVTAVDPKLPPLRRSALHFLTLLVKALTQAVNDGSMAELPSAPFLRRAKATLGYMSSMDDDATTRVMAREADEGINQLMKATLGL